MTGASLRDRATRPTDQAPAGLGDTASVPSAAHTPLPWGISYGFNLGLARAPATYVAGPKPEQIGIKLATPWREGAWDNDPEADANVAFIVRACNSHYELVEALEAAAQELFPRGVVLAGQRALVDQITGALAKARGEQ